MITTSRVISFDTVGSNGTEPVHLTGSLRVLARTTMGGPTPDAPIGSPVPIQVDLRFDATRVRGVGLKTGARYWAEGIHQSRHQPAEFSSPFDVVSRFELRGCAPDGSQPVQWTLSVSFRVIVSGDGRVTVTAGNVGLLPTIETPRGIGEEGPERVANI
jgi:hypothetical protein